MQDPEAKKPEDWDERPEIADETDTKPEGWDDIPKTIADETATKPDGWDEEDDGVWEPPQIPNPEYKGEWKPKMIENPNYKVCRSSVAMTRVPRDFSACQSHHDMRWCSLSLVPLQRFHCCAAACVVVWSGSQHAFWTATNLSCCSGWPLAHISDLACVITGWYVFINATMCSGHAKKKLCFSAPHVTSSHSNPKRKLQVCPSGVAL